MKRVFADAHFYIAILSRRDADRERAVLAFAEGQFTEVVTTVGILLEVADGMASSAQRAKCASFLEQLRNPSVPAYPITKVISLKDELVARALSLYAKREDKEWSLTDCISFVVMSDEGLTDALTGDHHFEQAGFTALMA